MCGDSGEGSRVTWLRLYNIHSQKKKKKKNLLKNSSPAFFRIVTTWEADGGGSVTLMWQDMGWNETSSPVLGPFTQAVCVCVLIKRGLSFKCARCSETCFIFTFSDQTSVQLSPCFGIANMGNLTPGGFLYNDLTQVVLLFIYFWWQILIKGFQSKPFSWSMNPARRESWSAADRQRSSPTWPREQYNSEVWVTGEPGTAEMNLSSLCWEGLTKHSFIGQWLLL